jgi:hypothetical protein
MAYMVAGSDQVFGGNFQPGGITGAAQGGNAAAKKLVQMGYKQPVQQQQANVTQPQANVTKAPDMSMYAPGKAQPTQTQSQGSPYGNPQTGGGYQMPEPPTGGGFQLPQQQTQYGGSQLMTQLQQQYGQSQGYPMPQQGRQSSSQQPQGYPMPQPPGSQYRTNEPPVATSSGRAYGGDMMVPYSDANPRPQQYGGLMADPEDTRRYDEMMARNGVSRQDYADPRYQDYLRAQGQRMGDPGRDIEEFGRYKRTGQTQNQLPPPPVNSAQPMPGQGGIPQDAVFRGMPGTYAMPPQFQTQMTDMFGNPTTPDQYFPQQDAFVAQLIERLGQNQSGTYLGQGAPPADWGRPQPFDINNLWGNAGDMVQGGWRNPFAAPIEANPFMNPYGFSDAYSDPYSQYGMGFGGFRDWQQPSAPPPSAPAGPVRYVNDAGESFMGTMSFAPNTPLEYQNQAYDTWARNEGYLPQPMPQKSPWSSGTGPRGGIYT